ncbi:MAG: hypothetical protein WC760_00965 [Bacteroidia bacterium]|jgi:hypothetical protein
MHKSSYNWQLLPLTILAFLFYFTQTCGLPGVTHDSIFYFQGAEYLLKGQGYLTKVFGIVKPAMHFPPMYPMLLAGLKGLTGMEFTTATLVLNGICWSVSISGLCLLFQRNQLSLIVSYGLALLCMLQHDVITMYYMAWSEALFITLMIWGMHLLLIFSKEGKLNSGLLAGVILGLATVTRYAGFVFVPFLFVYVWWTNESIKTKIRRIFIPLSTYLIPVLLWMIRNYTVSGKWMSRENNITDSHLPSSFLETGMRTLSSWLHFESNSSINIIGPGIIVLVLIIGLYAMYRFHRDATTPIPELAWVMLFLTYLALLILTAKYADKITLPDYRLLAPANLMFSILLCQFLIHWLKSFSLIKYLITAILLYLTYGELNQTRYRLAAFRNNGMEFTDRKLLEQKPVIDSLKNLQDSLPILSDNNEDDYLHYLTGKTILYPNAIYDMEYGQQLYFAFYHERKHLPDLGYTYLKSDTIIPGYLYKVMIK